MGPGEKTQAEEYDEKHGTYKSNVPQGERDLEETLPIPALPMGPQPDPFKLGPSGR